MKNTLWIFLVIGIIAGMWLYLRKKDTLELATGLKPVTDYLPGTDIPVGLRPIPGDRTHTIPIALGEEEAFREAVGRLSSSARRIIEKFKWF